VNYVRQYRSGRTEDEARQKAAKKFNVGPEKISLKQGDVMLQESSY